ncbi:MAG: CBS domain-containing protein [Candidatus Woesearchaeota archaeon]
MQIFKVEQWMVRNVITVGPQTPISIAAELMAQNNIGSLIVVENGEPIGIITEQDIVRKVVATKKLPEQVPVAEVMSKKIVTAEKGTTINEISDLMVKHRVKRIPVVENGKLCGIITSTDIVRTMAAFNKLYDVKDIIELGA